jgi:hypothetical protein
MSNSNPYADLQIQDNPAAAHTNLKNIVTRWNLLMRHLGTNVATKQQISTASTDVSGLAARVAVLETEVSALEATSTQRTFAFFSG